MAKKLITSALPYVNNVPHLGNLIQMLSADVFARFCRSRGYETLYVCGTDEYGTATETKALEEGTTPKALCDKYYNLHKEIYDWFHISFDKFGRTSNDEIKEITQKIFLDLDANGFIKEHETKQLFCPHCNMFLADRYVDGTCPKCGSHDARGDQCESCGTLLEPTDLLEPKCHTCGTTPIVKQTKHLYLDLPAIAPALEKWIESASVRGEWSANAIQMTKAWIRDGLNERAITRDLKWGISVPKAGFENKVFYVWFDAPIGYISITAQLANELKAAGKKSFDWKSWWLSSEVGKENDIELFQFIGKDNIPFHTVIFPSSLIGTKRDWTKLFHMSATEFLNYEDGKFSKSKGVGVFGTDAKESGIPSDAWRFYIFYNRPEKSDYQFTWKDFQEKYNAELIGNLGNLVNRTVLFVTKYYDGKIPQSEIDSDFWKTILEKEKRITDLLEWAEIKDAFHEIFSITDFANKLFQKTEPWKARTENPAVAEKLIYNLCYLIKDVSIMLMPYLPVYAQKVASFFGKEITDETISSQTKNAKVLSWNDLGNCTGLTTVSNTSVFFSPLDNKTVQAFREQFSGKQKNQKPKTEKKVSEKKTLSDAEQVALFSKSIRLKVAKVISIERNPESDKLYIEHLDDGSGCERVIQSGLVPYLREDEILGKHIILADNLAPRKMRGVESRGMLLAADYTDETGKQCVELLEAPWANPGDEIVLEGEINESEKAEIGADTFFSVQIKIKNFDVMLGGKKLCVAGKSLRTQKTKEGEAS